MFGKLGDMMGKLNEMKAKAEEVKRKLDDSIVEVDGAGGDIKIKLTGNRLIKEISITPSLQHSDNSELVEQLVVTLNKALEKANALNEKEMKEVAGSMLPGLM
ncbi:MAG: YbaB/EbfC family nucleoid-associated protein [Bacteroidota bacterium]|jgi:DNA-binding protein YbaB|nr:YbaB/EbfC family nucleoid-associated protein [Bacteroidota bacterium]MCA6445355.1 YbaB/EbfC family nucleoid-associated protein [Bacteroidota bacterium]